jgi:hypothetical protein
MMMGQVYMLRQRNMTDDVQQAILCSCCGVGGVLLPQVLICAQAVGAQAALALLKNGTCRASAFSFLA